MRWAEIAERWQQWTKGQRDGRGGQKHWRLRAEKAEEENERLRNALLTIVNDAIGIQGAFMLEVCQDNDIDPGAL